MAPTRIGLFSLAALLLATGPVWPGEPRLHLSWRAPYGMPRASDTLSVACADPTGRDTLYLTYETGKHSPFFVGIEGAVYFRAALGDTLSPFWQFDKRGANVELDFSVDSIPGCERPFKGVQKLDAGYYDRTAGSGRIRITQVVPITHPISVRDSTHYFLARLIVSRPQRPGCEKPVCIEWATADLSLDSASANVTKAGREGQRLASWNSRNAAACGDFRPTGPPKPAPWRPKASTGRR